MTLTPQEARKLNAIDQRAVKALERRIDAKLSKEYGRYGSNRFTIDVQESDYRVIQEIERMYTQAGWYVEHHTDQRDGDFLQFVPHEKYGGSR